MSFELIYNLPSDDPFHGTEEDFENKRLPMYKRWSQVKDDDTIPAYIATPKAWHPECVTLNKGN